MNPDELAFDVDYEHWLPVAEATEADEYGRVNHIHLDDTSAKKIGALGRFCPGGFLLAKTGLVMRKIWEGVGKGSSVFVDFFDRVYDRTRVVTQSSLDQIVLAVESTAGTVANGGSKVIARFKRADKSPVPEFEAGYHSTRVSIDDSSFGRFCRGLGVESDTDLLNYFLIGKLIGVAARGKPGIVIDGFGYTPVNNPILGDLSIKIGTMRRPVGNRVVYRMNFLATQGDWPVIYGRANGIQILNPAA